MTTEKKRDCLTCKERYPACQDTCPDKSKGTLFRNPDSEYLAYRSALFTKRTRQRLRRKH